MKKDIKSLSLSEMEALQKDLNKEIEKRAKVRARIQKILDDSGMTADELFGEPAKSAPAAPAPAAKGPAKAGGKKKARRKTAGRKAKTRGKGKSKVAPKYRNPANPDETWAGRGRKPQWLVDEISKGKSVEDFKIADA